MPDTDVVTAPNVDHTKPHWCENDGGPCHDGVKHWPHLFYLGAAAGTPELETRDCPHVAAPRIVNVVEEL